jgi:hypothetical protein
MTTAFNPTHRITTDRETVDVMLVDGAAYQKCEWESSTGTDYFREHGWLFQGQPFTGTVERLYRLAFMLESTGDFEIVETFAARDNFAANAYAEKNYYGRSWYVLNAEGDNING